MTSRALLLVNRKARQAEQRVDDSIELLQSLGLELIEPEQDDSRNLSDIIRHYRGQVDLVIVGGGDGSLNAAADGLVDVQLPLGILPLGTANDLARTLDIPLTLPEACQVISAGHTKRIDLGQVNGKHFFNVASIGLSVEVARQLSSEAKSRWGVLAYLFTAVRVAWKARAFSAVIRCDGETIRTRTLQIAVGNGRHYGGGMTVAEDAAIDDGLFDMYSLEMDHWWEFIPLFPALRHGKLTHWSRARTFRGRNVEVHAHRSRPVNTDGEITTHTPAKFRMAALALSVLVPQR